MKYSCETCKFFGNGHYGPCKSCAPTWIIGDHNTPRIGWQPAYPKRKELEAELADWKREYDVQQQRACDAEAKHKKLEAEYAELRQRYDALMNCYMLNEEPDGPVMVVDFGKVLVKHEAQLTTANAEIESMHRELAAARQQAADKQAIIEEQKREIAEANRKVNFAMNKWEDVCEENEQLKKDLAGVRKHIPILMSREAKLRRALRAKGIDTHEILNDEDFE